MSGDRKPSRSEYALTTGEIGAAAAQTVLVVLLPVLISKYARSQFWIGFAVGGEGVFALAVPFLAGLVSDRLPGDVARRFGRRMVLLFFAAPLMAVTIALTPFLSGYWIMTGVAFLFFFGLHAYLTPLWALMADGVPDERRAQAQGMRGVFRASGLAYGLVAAGLLFAVWKPLPFLVAALLVLGATGVTWWAERKTQADRGEEARSMSRNVNEMWHALKDNRAASWLLLANALWNGAIDGIRPYIFLFATTVIGVSVAMTSVGLIALILGIAIGSWVLGKLGDRHDRGRLLEWGVALTTLALLGGFFARGIFSAMVVLLLGGLGAASIITLPYPLFASLMGEEATGQYTGTYIVSVGFGRIFAPMLVGATIDLGKGVLDAKYHGYPFMWITAGVLAGLGWLALYRSKRKKDSWQHVDGG